ncbi:MAG: histidine phosphatase family protein [Kofleriaceae bacterium]
MHLYVIRHAVAGDAAPGQDDAERALTSDGERKFRKAVKGMRALDLWFDRVLTSPWTRAAETAGLLEPISDNPPIVTELLARPPSAELLEAIASPDQATAVVGHDPWLGELIAWLAFGDARRGEALLLKKGGIVWLEGSAVPGGMMMRAMIPPKLLRSLAR